MTFPSNYFSDQTLLETFTVNFPICMNAFSLETRVLGLALWRKVKIKTM